MNPVLRSAVIVVHAALVCYSLAWVWLLIRKTYSLALLFILVAAILFDIASVVLMVIGTTSKAITFHGIMGYSALLVMISEGFHFFRFTLKVPHGTPVIERWRRLFTAAYLYWIAAYLTGAVIVFLRVRS
jgi:hypothetical protein